jgi:hypothetical protein
MAAALPGPRRRRLMRRRSVTVTVSFDRSLGQTAKSGLTL